MRKNVRTRVRVNKMKKMERFYSYFPKLFPFISFARYDESTRICEAFRIIYPICCTRF